MVPPRPLAAPLPPHAGALLLLPLSVLLGGALFWPAACLVAIAAALERQHMAMLVWFGLAVGFDPLALMLSPFVLAIVIGRHVFAALLPVAGLAAGAMLLAHAPGFAPGFVPTLLLPAELSLTNGAPNVWAIAAVLPWIDTLPLTGLAVTATLGAAAAYVAWLSARPLARIALLDAALLGALVLPSLAPALDGRAFLLADGLALVLAVLDRKATRWRIALLAVGASGIAAWAGTAAPLGALAMLAATTLQARAVLKPAANDNPLLARAY